MQHHRCRTYETRYQAGQGATCGVSAPAKYNARPREPSLGLLANGDGSVSIPGSWGRRTTRADLDTCEERYAKTEQSIPATKDQRRHCLETGGSTGGLQALGASSQGNEGASCGQAQQEQGRRRISRGDGSIRKARRIAFRIELRHPPVNPRFVRLRTSKVEPLIPSTWILRVYDRVPLEATCDAPCNQEQHVIFVARSSSRAGWRRCSPPDVSKCKPDVDHPRRTLGSPSRSPVGAHRRKKRRFSVSRANGAGSTPSIQVVVLVAGDARVRIRPADHSPRTRGLPWMCPSDSHVALL